MEIGKMDLGNFDRGLYGLDGILCAMADGQGEMWRVPQISIDWAKSIE